MRVSMPVSSMKTRRAGAIPARSARHPRRPRPPRRPPPAAPRPRPPGPARRPRPSFLPHQAERLQRPAQGRGAAPDPGALGEPVGVLGQGGVVPLRHQPGQRLPRGGRLSPPPPPAPPPPPPPRGGPPAPRGGFGGAAPPPGGGFGPARR